MNKQIDELQVLIFTIGGVRMGTDASQIGGMLEMYQAEEIGMKTKRLHEAIPFHNQNIIYSSPKVLLLKNKDALGIVIDKPEDIVNIAIDNIRPLPSLFKTCGSKAIWGAALRDSEVILLADFHRIFM